MTLPTTPTTFTPIAPLEHLQPSPRAGWRAIWALMLREMATTFGRSPGGWIWAVAEPVAVIALLAFAFSLAFRAPSLGTSFPLFYATGYLPFLLFQDVSSKLAQSLRFSRPLMTYPRVTWFDALMARLALNIATHLVVACIVIAGIEVFWPSGAQYDARHLAAGFAMAAVVAVGVGTINCYLFTVFAPAERIWLIISRPLFIASGVFYIFEDLPGSLGDLLWYNPLLHVVGSVRAGAYGAYDPAYVTPLYPLGIGLGALTLGLILLRGHGADLLRR
ncbi:MAG: sugar ABC transporter permease [Rhodobacteraceae bacterium]|nr:sugar ABC transporter permease [Paracoccaceae bacterium]